MAVRKFMLVLALGCLLIVAVPGVVLAQTVWDRVRSDPVDATSVRERLGLQFPSRLVNLIKRDGVAYQAHASLASLIARTGGDPGAAGVQWFKAAAHARSNVELQRTVDGLRTASATADNRAELERTICLYLEDSWSGRQREAMSGAGMRCGAPARR